MYTIKKNGKYVRDTAKYGGDSSYTDNPQFAVKYSTYEEALKNCCIENEIIVKMHLEWV